MWLVTYTAGTNNISTIADAAATVWKDKGFKDGSTASYVYDVNGNMTTDPDKGMMMLPEPATNPKSKPNIPYPICPISSKSKLCTIPLLVTSEKIRTIADFFQLKYQLT